MEGWCGRASFQGAGGCVGCGVHLGVGIIHSAKDWGPGFHMDKAVLELTGAV